MLFTGQISISKQFLERLDKKIIIPVILKNEDEALSLLKQNKIYGFIYFPKNLTKEMLIKIEDPSYELTDKIKIRLDKSTFIVAGVVMSTIMNTFIETSKPSGSSPLPLEIETAMGINDVVFGDYIIPGIITIIVFLILIVGLSFIVFRDRQKINFRRYHTYEVLLPYLIIYSIAALISLTLTFLVAIPLFDMHINQGIWIALAGYSIFIITSTSIGVIIGIIMKKIEAIRIPILISILPIFFGNALLPMEAMPSWLRPIVYIFPHYYATKIYRGSIIKQISIENLSFEFYELLVFSIVFLVSSWIILSKKLSRRWYESNS
ncbi:MAG: ABC transporter permease [Brevinematia bacterium]